MSLGVGVIGCGAMGQIHLRSLLARPADVRVVGVYDPHLDRIGAAGLSTEVAVFPDSRALIRHSEVDLIVIASPASLHASDVVASLEAGKLVYCEKPLVTSMDDHHRIRALEAHHGRAMVWVGFMRRFDPLFQALKADLDRGAIGAISHGILSHRNPSVPPSFTDADYMLETFIHEFDALRWLVGVEIETISVGGEHRTARGLTDPQFVTLTTSGGQRVVIDGHITNGYGYDIRCELVGERGSRSLVDYVDRVGISAAPQATWATRFEAAYRSAIEAWIDDVLSQKHTGVTSHDAERALAVALSGIEAQKTGRTAPVRTS